MNVLARRLIAIGAPALALAGCTTPQPVARLPEAPYVAVLSGEMPRPIDRVARHAWIVAQPASGPPRRFELNSSGGPDPFEDFAAGDVMLHGVVTGSPNEIDEIIACLAAAQREYHQTYPEYFPIPGPNSNTFVALLGRRCDLGIELPATAIGRDYVGPAGAALTESGTGFIVGTWPLGLRVGLREGVSVIVFGLPFGVHFGPPGIELPVNPGRIGFATDGHVYRRPPEEDPFPDAPATMGAASIVLYAEALVTRRPDEARGLSGEGVVGVSARAVAGKYVGYAAGFDLEMGFAVPAGLAGRACLYPVGVGVLVSQTGFLAVFGGVGASGVTERLPSGLELPVEIRLEVDLAAQARVALYAREAFTFLEPRRDNGLFDLGEFTTGIRARLGGGNEFGGAAVGSGWFFGFERREMGRGEMLGFAFGTEVDAGYSGR